MRVIRYSASVLVAGVLLAGGGGPATAAPPPTPSPSPAATTPGPTFTLLTGDVVRLVTLPDGSRTGEIVRDVAPVGDIVFQQMTDGLYALTGDVARRIGAGRLDRDLFNLTKLAEFGYDDAHTAALPVITTVDTKARSAAPATPRGTKRKQLLGSINAESLDVAKDQAPAAWADLEHDDTRTVWLDGRAKASLDVSVPAVGAPAAWSAGLTGKGVTVGVVDTGIDEHHPDFAGRITASRSFVAGYPTAHDGNGHGTHVASIAAGSGAASGGRYRGVAPEAGLVVAKVMDDGGAGYDSDIIAGMEWVANQGAKVINMSLGGDPTDGTDPLSQAVNRISDATGALFVISAGNDGASGPQWVSAPGAADRALTVGSVDKTAPHGRSWFSSQGPRLGDNAVKPEITAPGADIVAAKATGSVIGDPVGDAYQSLSGTSMASPHVAGGAAILVQEHPDWSRDRIRDTLVSTADPHGSAAVTGEGGGMLDLAQATAGGLTATGTVNLGMLRPPYATTSRTVTLHNSGTEAVHATLGLALSKVDVARAAASPFEPGDAVTVSPEAVEVPAGGSATVTVTVRPDALDMASYYGFLEATAGDTVARTTLGWTKDHERVRLTVRAIDRTGAPAQTTCCSLLGLMDLETGQSWTGVYNEGRAYFYGLGYDPMLVRGRHYTLMTNISDWTTGEPFTKLSETVAGEPELVMDKDKELTFDARRARHVEYRTNRPVEAVDRAALGWERRVGTPGHDIGLMGQTFHGVNGAPDFYVLAGTSTASTGTFRMGFATQLVAPALTMAATDRRAPDLHPVYPGEYAQACDQVLRCTKTLSPGSYRVVDAGTGSPAELTAAGVRGTLALVHEVLAIDEWGSPALLDRLAADAAAAGAAGVLVAVADAGPARRAVGVPTAVPVAVLTHEEGERLGAALRTGPITVRTGGEPVSPYLYDLSYTVRDRMPADTVFEAGPRDVATVTARYHADKPGTLYQTSGYGTNQLIKWPTKVVAPFTRTEYVSPDHRWQVVAGAGGTEDSRRDYTAGTRVMEDFFAAPVAPGPYGDGPGLTAVAGGGEAYFSLTANPLRVANGYHAQNGSVATNVRYVRDGTVLCAQPYLAGCTVSPATPGRYRVELDTTQTSRPLSPSSRTAWEFNARLDTPESVENPYGETLPVVDVRYDVGVGMDNTVPAGSAYAIKVLPGYQPGYAGQGWFTVRAWVSPDDGATWTDLGTRVTGQEATFTAKAPRAGFVTLHVRATDAKGNLIDQTITRAWPVRR